MRLKLKIFEDKTDFLQFLRIEMWIVFACVAIGGVTQHYEFVVFIFCFGTVVALLGNFGGNWLSGILGSLYHHGSREKDHALILKGMFNKARGLILNGQYAEAEAVYKEIQKEYPEDLDSWYHLARLYDRNLNRPEEALKKYQRLMRLIKEKAVSYKYQDALNRNIEELKERLKD